MVTSSSRISGLRIRHEALDTAPHPDSAEWRSVCCRELCQSNSSTAGLGHQRRNSALEMMFYTAKQFPERYRGNAFAAEHGSWNRSKRTGYKIISLPLQHGVPTGEYDDFMTGFVISDDEVWGRPVGVVQAEDGSLFVSDDGSNTVWKVMYSGTKQ